MNMRASSEQIAREKSTNCTISLQSIEKFLALMATQQTEYSNISYKACGPFALVLRAKKNGIKEVALKVLEYTDHTVNKIQAMESEYAMRKQLPFSDYFMAIQNQFFLTEVDQSFEQGKNGNSNTAKKAYFVQEMEMCQGSLEESIEWQQQNCKNPLSESFSELLAIQMLDAVNLLHSREMAHGDITMQHFLVSSSQDFPIILKLCNLVFNFPCNPKKIVDQVNTNKALSDMPFTTECQSDSIQQDLFSLGKIFLQLDNIGTNFDLSTIPNSEDTLLYVTTLFETHKLYGYSTLFKIACMFLKKSKDNSQGARSMLLLLLSKYTQTNKIPLFSVTQKIQVNSLHLQIPLKRTILDFLSYQACKERELNHATGWFNAKGQRKTELSVDLLRSALNIMLEWQEYGGAYDILGVGVGGVVFGVENLKEKRKSALKLSLCTNKAEKIREINIMKICQGPNIVKLYGYKFFKDAISNEFVVYELERCKFSLAHHLELQRIQGEYSDEKKNLMSLQILDSVNFLHENRVLHRNIKLDSFFITENESRQVVVKLGNFSHAVQLQESFEEVETIEKQIFEWKYESPVNCILQKHNRESPLYFAPERWDNPNLSTCFTDSFSVGLCIFLLDNYLVCSEEQLAQKLFSFHPGRSDEIFQDINQQINTKRGVYQIANQLIKFLPNQRTSLRNLTEKPTQSSKQNKKKSKDVKQNSLQQQMMLNIKDREALRNFQKASKKYTSINSFSLNLDDQEIEDSESKVLLSPLANLLNLSNLALDLSCNQIGDIGAKYLLSPLANLLNLSNLTLDIQCNQIRETAAQFLLSPLANLLNLSNLALNFSCNTIGDRGAQFLLSPLANLLNLSSLSLNLDNTSINELGAESLLSPLATLPNLSSLALDLRNNQILEKGAQSLLTPLTNLLELSSLTLNLYYNSIGDIGAKSLLSPLQNCLNLTSLSLNLEMNQIGDIGAKSLLSPLADLLNLQSLVLHIDYNQIGDPGAESLLFPLANLLNLTSLTLTLEMNQNGYMAADTLLAPLANLHNLSNLELNMRYNSLGVSGAGSFLSPLSNLVNLKSILLIVQQNEIGDIGTQSLLSPLSKILNLSRLSLNLCLNEISDIGAYSLLYPLSNMLNLSSLVLQLKDNILTKQIDHLCQKYFKNLKFLQIDY